MSDCGALVVWYWQAKTKVLGLPILHGLVRVRSRVSAMGMWRKSSLHFSCPYVCYIHLSSDPSGISWRGTEVRFSVLHFCTHTDSLCCLLHLVLEYPISQNVFGRNFNVVACDVMSLKAFVHRNIHSNKLWQSLPWFRWLVAGLSLRRLRVRSHASPCKKICSG
jgi:hypothetical protein